MSCTVPSARLPYLPRKDTLLTLALSFFPAVIGLFGIGHFYLGKPLRGIALFVVGGVAAVVLVFGGRLMGGAITEDMRSLLFVFLAALVAVNVADAFLLARRFNREAGKAGVEPW